MKLCHSDFFIVRASGGKTCEPTPHPHSEVQEQEMILADELASGLRSSGRSEQKWLKRQCFRRDENRCVITGSFDREHSQPDQDNVPTNCDIEQTRISPADMNVVENA